MCGLVVTTDDTHTIVRIRGDDDHPLSRGYTCPKGRAVGALHHDPRRLDRPAMGRGAQRVDVTWDALLDDLATRLGALRNEHGPDSVAMYLASGSAFDTAGRRAAERFLQVFGSAQKYTATTIDTPCKPLVAEAVGGWSGLTPIWDHEHGSLLLLFGTNPVVSHGHSNAIPDPVQRLREFRARGGEVWVFDPRHTETARQADRYVAIAPGSDWLVLAWLVRSLLADPAVAASARARATGFDDLVAALSAVDRDSVIDGTRIDPAAIDALVTTVRAHGRLAALTGTGCSMGVDANVTEYLLWSLHILTDSADRAGGMWCNPGYLMQLDTRDWEAADGVPGDGPPSRPELPRRFGEWPVAGLVSEIEAGNVRALVVVGGNPVTAFPDTTRTRAALATLDTVALVDLLPTETTEYATHLLPATDQLERADLTWLLDSYQLAVAAQYTEAVVPAVADRRPPWWMFASLARGLGFSVLPGDPDPDTIDDRTVLEPLVGRSRDGAALLAAPTAVVASGAVYGWVYERVLPEGGWRLGPASLLAQLTTLLTRTRGAGIPTADANDAGTRETSTGLTLVAHRRLRMMNSQFRDIAAPGAAVEQPGVLAHPDLVASLGGVGTPVVVTSAHGALDGRLVADDRLRRDVIAIAHGFGDENVSLLTSAEHDIDELTGMVHQSGLPVTIEARE